MKKYGKKTLIITRAVLFAVGTLIGYLAMHGILSAYPEDISGAIRYVYCVGTGILVGLILLLSAHSVLWIVFTLGYGVKNLFSGKRPASVAGVFIGLAVGGMLTYLFDFLISLELSIISLRVILDVVFGVIVVGIAVYMALKALARPSDYESTAASEDAQPLRYSGGYVLTASALKCDGIEEFCSRWLIGDVAVLDVTVSRLIGGGRECEKALKAYGALRDCGAAYTVSVGGGSESEEVLGYAEKFGMRIIAANSDEFSGDVPPVLGFGELIGKFPV